MTEPERAKLHQDGAAAYALRGHSGFLQNPYLKGPTHEAEALAWWRGYDAARARARAHDSNASS